jgi:hypothetical protein
MNAIRIPYHKDGTNAKPTLGATAISKILKKEFSLKYGIDYNWHWDFRQKNLVIAFSDEYASMASLVALRFTGVDLYALQE